MLRGIRAEIAFQANVPIHVHPFEVDGSDRVFLALKPIACYFRKHDLAETVLPREALPVRNERSRLRSKISPDQPRLFLDAIRLDPDLVLEPCSRCRNIVVGLFDAVAVLPEQPAVIVAPQSAGFNVSVREIGPPVCALAVDEAVD